LVEKLVEASPTVGRIRGAHWDHLHVEKAHTTGTPRLAHRVPFQEPQQTKALETAEVEAGRTRPGAALPRHEHESPQSFVALLGSAAHGQEGPAFFLHTRAYGAMGRALPVFSGFFSVAATLTK
jgi:hypothetical protein